MGAFKIGAKLWSLGVVPYEANPTHEFWSLIQAAMNEINTKTKVVFREKVPTDQSWIYFTCDKTKSNFSGVGMYPGAVHINIKHNVRVLHELGHVLGMIHEHQRSDRDEYIEMREKNYNANDLVTKSAIVDKESFTNGTTYDVHSIMQYWCTAHCLKNSCWRRYFTDNRTMVYKPEPKLKFSTPEVLSTLDIECINKTYAGEITKRDFHQKAGEPVVHPAAPVIHHVQPVVHPNAPIVHPAEPVVHPTTPVIHPVESIVHPAETIIQPQIIQPIEPAAQLVTGVTA